MKAVLVSTAFTAAFIGLALSSELASAKGCVKGAIVGGVAGHYVGHHGLLGAGAGCVIGHHEANKHARERAYHEGYGSSARQRPRIRCPLTCRSRSLRDQVLVVIANTRPAASRLLPP